MRLVPTAVIETMTAPVIRRGRWVYILDRDGKVASRGIDPNRIAPLGQEQIAAIRWRHAALVCRSRLRCEAMHFSVRGPWEARATRCSAGCDSGRSGRFVPATGTDRGRGNR